MDWIFNHEPLTEAPEGYVGFVYLIINNNNGKSYLGQKKFWATRTRTVKGKKKRKLVESDWRKYYGSSQALLDDLAVQGPERFDRFIIHLCKTKGEMNFLELEEQILSKVLRNPAKWYNNFIGGKIHGKHVKHLQESS